jgi:hypothetical protein
MKDLPSPINESGTGWSQLGQDAYPVRSELVQSSGRIYCMTRTGQLEDRGGAVTCSIIHLMPQ